MAAVFAAMAASLVTIAARAGYSNIAEVLMPIGETGVYHSPTHLTAAYLSPTQLTLTMGAGIATPVSSQFLSVEEIKADGSITMYHRGNSTFTLAGAILAVGGATFVNTSTFVVVYVGIQRGLEKHDTAIAQTLLHVIGAQAEAGVPAAVTDQRAARLAVDLTRSLRVHLSAGTDYTTSSMTTREVPGSGYAHGTRDCTAANTAYALAAASTPCFAVLMCAREANAGICITGGSTITTTGGQVPKISVGCAGWTFVDDLAKVYVASSNAGDDVDFVYLTR